MLPDEIYANNSSSSHLKYSHPLNRAPLDDSSLRARLAYDMMSFMKRKDCPYYLSPESYDGYNLANSDDEIDIMIVDGYYKEAELLIDMRLEQNPHDEKAMFQKSFIQYLYMEYEKILEREDRLLQNDPRNVSALINKGFALANLNREEEALKIADKALSIDPDNLTVLSNKAYIAKLLGRDELREKTLMRAYNVSAKNHMANLEKLESKLLADFGAAFVEIDTPSAFEAFNNISGVHSSKMVH